MADGTSSGEEVGAQRGSAEPTTHQMKPPLRSRRPAALISTSVVVVLAILAIAAWFVHEKTHKSTARSAASTTSLLARYAEGEAGHTFDAHEGFRIDFPIEPDRKFATIGSTGLPIVTYAIVAPPESFSVLFVDYRGLREAVPQLLRATVEGVAKNVSGMIESSQEVLFNGFPAIDYVVRYKNGYARGRAVMVNGRFYQLYVTSPALTTTGYDRFVNSFSIRPLTP